MAQTIKLKRSSTGGAVPSTSSLSLGEVAINTYDGKMYIKKNDGSDAIVEVTGTQQTAVFKAYSYTAGSSQTTYTGSDNNSDTLKYVSGFIEVYLNGILLNPATDYTGTNGFSIVLTDAPTTGDLLQVNTFVKVLGTADIIVDTFTGVTNQVAFTLSSDPGTENNTNVFVNAVYQTKDTYSVSGTTLTFGTAPASGDDIEIAVGSRNLSLIDIDDLNLGGALTTTTVTASGVVTASGGNSGQWNTGYSYSQVGHLPSAGGALSGAVTTNSTFDGRDVAADGVTADAALPKAGGAMTGAITTNSTFDGRDVAADGVTADAALPKAGGTMTGNIVSGDNVKATYGTGADLEIYHDGSASYIHENGLGNLNIQATGSTYIKSSDSTLTSAQFIPESEVRLFYNNSQKLRTTTTGINVTGSVTANDVNITDSTPNLKFTDTDGTHLANITQSGTHLYMDNDSTGDIRFRVDTNTEKLKVHSSGIDVTGNIAVTGTVDGVDIATRDALHAPLASPSLTGVPVAPTAAGTTSTTQLATTAFVQQELTTLIGGAPSTLNDLNELAAAINDDANYNSTLTTALATKLPLAGGTMTGNIVSGDNVKATYGTGADLQIYHDGSNSYIRDAGTGNLVIRGTSLNLQKDGGESYITMVADGAVTAYYDNAAKLATTSTGIDVTGSLNLSNHLDMPDNATVKLGTSDDLQIYHDGLNSYIKDVGTGTLNLQGATQVLIGSATTGEVGLQFVENAGVTLRHNNIAKISTTSTGIDVTGTVTSDGLTVSTSSAVTASFSRDGSDGDSVQIFNGAVGTTRVLGLGGTGNDGTINSQYGGVKIQPAGQTSAFFSTGGDVSFYEDTGTTAKLIWDASAESLGIGTAPTSLLHVGGAPLATSGSLTHLRNTTATSSNTSFGGIFFSSSPGTDYTIGKSNVNSVTTLSFRNANTGASYMDIASTGNVNIGVPPAGTGSSWLQVLKDNNNSGNQFSVADTEGATAAIRTYTHNGDINGLILNHYYAKTGSGNEYMRYADIVANVGNGAGTTLRFITKNAANTYSTTVIDNNGNVGIGTTTPAVRLHIKDTTADTELRIETGGGNDAILNLVAPEAGGAESQILFSDSVTGSGRITYSHNSGGTDFMRFVTATTEKMRIDSTGNVGIGIQAPTVALDVVGTINSDANTLNAIAKDISDTAVDIFVYDTRKDSDGGAWRKRTQHTSWYNETLNTSTRGARKEFPAVAIIVAESAKVTIYDGDDPDMPMWMVFNGASYSMLSNTHNGITGATMKNGNLVVISTSGYNHGGVSVINFISDYAYLKTAGYTKENATGIVNRGNAFYGSAGSLYIVNNNVNDVALSLLPNAPIDSATGLPIPTIAVATDGGVSVIKDDGTVVDITSASHSNATQINFTKENQLSFYNVPHYSLSIRDIPTSDVTGLDMYTSSEFRYSSYDVVGSPNLVGDSTAGNVSCHTHTPNYEVVTGSASGMTSIQRVPAAPTTGLSNYITKDYNTGYMVGDIKLAALSDTDTTNVVGSELVTNGDFTTNTTGWTAYSGSTISVDSGRFKVLQQGGSSAFGYQGFTTVVGKTYTASVDFISVGTNTAFRVGTTTIGSDLGFTGYASASRTESLTFVATATTTYTSIQSYASTGHYALADNISVRLADVDRSVNANGLQVHGTVTKTAVATGADLVGYSFGSNIYLKAAGTTVPAGTNDACYMWWSVDTVGDMSQCYLGDPLNDGSVPSYGINVWSYGPGMKYRYAASQFNATTANGIIVSAWNHHCMMSRNGLLEVYINGKFAHRATSGHNGITETDLYIGKGHYNNDHSDGMSLFRISATIPSPQQIKEIYEAEKPLFQAGAQATLYGSSDAVTALAHDDDTNLLHVGTSSGRSVFQGLRRVENTTTAVGAAISASNGMVAED